MQRLPSLAARPGAAWLLLACLCMLVYWPARHDIFRADQVLTAMERVLVEGEWAWMHHLLGFTRARYHHVGDQYLFRPLLYALIWTTEALMRDRPLAAGVFGLLVFTTSAWILYCAARRIVDAVTALLLAAISVCLFTGIEAASWRHIMPMVMAFPLLMLGLVRYAGQPDKWFVAALAILSACLFHELAVVAATGVLVLTALAWLAGANRKLFSPRLVFLLLGCISAYFLLNILDVLWHYRGRFAFTGPDDTARHLADMLKTPALVLAASIEGVFAPSFVDYDFGAFASRLVWPFYQQSASLLALFGVLAVPLVVFSARRGLGPGARSVETLWLLGIGTSLVGVLGGLAVGRVALRGLEYLSSAPYYFSVLGSIWLASLALVLPRRSDSRASRIARFALCALLVQHAFLTRSTLERSYDWRTDVRISEAIRAGVDAAEAQSTCFAGVDPEFHKDYVSATVSVHLLRRSCGFEGSGNGRPGLLLSWADGRSHWKEMPPEPQGVPLEMPLVPGLGAARRDVWMTARSTSEAMELRLTNVFSAHLQISSGREFESGPLFTIDRCRVRPGSYEGLQATAAAAEPGLGYVLLCRDGSMSLSLRRWGRGIALFSGRNLVAVHEDFPFEEYVLRITLSELREPGKPAGIEARVRPQ